MTRRDGRYLQLGVSQLGGAGRPFGVEDIERKLSVQRRENRTLNSRWISVTQLGKLVSPVM